jgi:hypothetical protein
MESLTVAFEVVCSVCGAKMAAQAGVARDWTPAIVKVQPCAACLEARYQTGFDDGKFEAGLNKEDGR